MNLPVLPQDTANHVVYGGAAAIAVGLPVAVLLPGTGAGAVAGQLAGVAVGGWKEWRDRKTGKGKPEWRDFWNTVAGASVVSLALGV
jgi:hypothetical protein